MIRGTTPTHTFLCDLKQEDIENIYVTYEQRGQLMFEKTIDDITFLDSGKGFVLRLTQEDTLKLDPKYSVEFQIRVKMKNGTALANEIMKRPVSDILKDEEI